MSPLRRRSSRLRNSHATPGKSAKKSASNRLASLVERDETPSSGPEASFHDSVSSPLAPRTPATGRVKAPKEEMHPSKAHHSTTQEPDSGLRLGFTDMEVKGNDLPSGVSQQTPSKTGISSTFDFRFAHPGPQLGPEAQRMMQDLREEAQRIKARLAAERDEESRRAEESGKTLGGRKIAHPKGKAGRFSDVHMAEFKKMDSIAGHPSAFRAQPGRLTPAAGNLKRTQSKAQLDERDPPAGNLKRTQSKAQLDDRERPEKRGPSNESSSQSERLENTAPAKRARKHIADDTSSSRPLSRGNDKPLPATPKTGGRTQASMLAALTTPTQASLARASSVKTVGSHIPTLSRSPSKPNLNFTPQGITQPATGHATGPRSGFKSMLRSPGKFERMKSMLRHPSASAKQSMPPSFPALARSPGKPNVEKTLPVAPSTPRGPSTPGSKKVTFDSENVLQAATSQNSPSPMKSGIPRSISKIHLGNRLPISGTSGTRPQSRDTHKATITGQSKIPAEIVYPSLAGVRPLPEPPRQSAAVSNLPPSVPGTFTFRSDHTISFGKSPEGFGSSPGQASVRQVRPSIFPSIPGTFPDGNKENSKPLPSVSHGMSNKKRHRVDSDDEQEEEVERSSKKHKTAPAEGQMLMAPGLEAEKMASNSKAQSPAKKRGVLSLSRLNMLARPKVRK